MSSNIKVLVKYNQPNERSAKLLLDIYSQQGIRIINRNIVENGFIFIFDNIREAEKIFNDDNMTAVSLNNFVPVLPKEIVCERTLFIKLNKVLLSNSTEDLKQELENNHEGIKIAEATKITNSNYLKITVDSIATADRLLKEGVKIFNLYTPGSYINKQRFIEVIECTNCFMYNDHQAKFCPEPKSVRCTNCKGHGHRYRSCTINRDQISCFHCNENHYTLYS